MTLRQWVVNGSIFTLGTILGLPDGLGAGVIEGLLFLGCCRLIWKGVGAVGKVVSK